MNEYNYTENKIKNHFTAYLQKCIRWKRNAYLKKKENIYYMELPLGEGLQMQHRMTLEEMAELCFKEDLLLKECNGIYPKWNELSDQKLIAAFLVLSEEEKRIIYQHVFEKRTFEELRILNGITEKAAKEIYFYAIRKIRNLMGGER